MDKIYKQTERTIEEHIQQQEKKPHNTVHEPSYAELACWCKLNIKELLQIGFADSDKHIDEHYGGECGLLTVIDGYIQILNKIYDICERESELYKPL